MQTVNVSGYLPLWGILLATVLIVLLAIEAGFRVGRYRNRRSSETEAPLGTVVAAALGLVAFLLAFTFGLASSRFDARRQVLLDESNAIGTAYLRAAFLPEPERTDTRDLLREYVDVRLEGVRTGNLEQAIRRSVDLHGQLWSNAALAEEKDTRSIGVGLYVQSLNGVIDLHSNRVAVGIRSRIPVSIWIVLYASTSLAMTLIGYYLGLSNPRRSIAIPAFALTFSVVLALISDLDRPGEGLITVSQQAMVDLRGSMTP